MAYSLYGIVTTLGGEGSYPLDPTMMILDRHLIDAGIPWLVANAMAGVVGENPDWEWVLMSATRAPDAPSTGSTFRWDDKDRYFFKYHNKSFHGTYEIILEYTRFDPPHEIRGVAITYDSDGKAQISDASVTDRKVREAIVGMMLAILWAEASDTYPLAASEFKKKYSERFASGPTVAVPILRAVYDTLADYVNPAKASSVTAPLPLNSTCLNARNKKLKQILEGSNTVGYINSTTGKILLAADTAVKTHA